MNLDIYHKTDYLSHNNQNCCFIRKLWLYQVEIQQKIIKKHCTQYFSLRSSHFINLFCPITGIWISYFIFWVFLSLPLIVYLHIDTRQKSCCLLCPVSQTHLTVTIQQDVCSHVSDAGASDCPRVIHKKVGDTVELPSCSSTEGITRAKWRYGGENIAVKDINISAKQFQGRLYFNPTNFSLTLTNLTVQDSGEFDFASRKEKVQLDTVIVNLHVHGETPLFFIKIISVVFFCGLRFLTDLNSGF